MLGRGRGYGRNTGGREGFCLCDSVTDRAEGGGLGADEGLLVEVGSRGICWNRDGAKIDYWYGTVVRYTVH